MESASNNNNLSTNLIRNIDKISILAEMLTIILGIYVFIIKGYLEKLDKNHR